MGKHKKESKKHKHKRKKERRSRKSSSSEEEEWVEKRTNSSSDEEIATAPTTSAPNDSTKQDKVEENKREDWMSLPTAFLSVSNLDKHKSREEQKKREREQQQYNPAQCSRELNPYWKHGGDGLPKFKKPSDDHHHNKSAHSSKVAGSKWKKRDSDAAGTGTVTSNFNKPDSPTPSTGLSDKELNVLASKLVKAEIMGNTELVQELKQKLDSARSGRQLNPASDVDQVILTHTDAQGQVRPLKLQSEGEPSGSKRKKQKLETHHEGQRVRYFADDDKYSLKQMFENEKYQSVQQQNEQFIKMAGKVRKNDDLDDIFADTIRTEDKHIDTHNKNRAIGQHQRMTESLDGCRRCLQSEVMPKHLMIAMNDSAYLSLPAHEPLTDGHCCIVPLRHVTCATQLDENEWSDLMDFRRALTNMFASQNRAVIFFEIAMSLHRYPHMHVECVPLRKKDSDMAPFYFKKAIDESETEWVQNKKLVVMKKGKNVRQVIPKGLPYFWVSFDTDDGYAHVIEDEKRFPANFAQEIIGGMLDLHHSKWRKPRKQTFEEQSAKIVEFSKYWSNFDCTIK